MDEKPLIRGVDDGTRFVYRFTRLGYLDSVYQNYGVACRLNGERLREVLEAGGGDFNGWKFRIGGFYEVDNPYEHLKEVYERRFEGVDKSVLELGFRKFDL